MKKVAVLVCKTRAGDLMTEAAESLIPIEERAREIREAGEIDGVPVDSGFVLATWRAGAVMQFRCEVPKPKAHDKKG